MKKILIFLLIFIFNLKVYGNIQFQKKELKESKLSYTLFKLLKRAKQYGENYANTLAREKGIKLYNNKYIKVIVETENLNVIDNIKSLLHKKDITIISSYKNLLKLKIKIRDLEKLSNIKDVKRVREPLHFFYNSVKGEEITLTSASKAFTNNYTGEGIRVAVIDGGFYGLNDAINAGELPSNVITYDFSGYGLTNDTMHGTAVAEIIYEMAPDVQLYLLKIGDSIDLGNAVDYCIKNEINIINHSMGWVNSEWGDGTGTICDIANIAIDSGILWVNSAGNSAKRHWQGMFVANNFDDYNDFDDSTEDGEINEIGYYPAGSVIQVFLCWNDKWGRSSNDYDLYLYRYTGSSWEEVDSSINGQSGYDDPVEQIVTIVSTSGFYGVKIMRYIGVIKECQLFSFNSDFENYTTAHSLMAPADAERVLTVGAIAYSNWETGPIEPYSSQGPTENGIIKPDICGVDYNTNYTYGRFPGTSAASPCVAGAAAVVWSGYNSYTVEDVRNHLLNDAIDMGISGKDNIYGEGKVNIKLSIQGVPSIRDRGFFNSTDDVTFVIDSSDIKNKRYILFIQISTNKYSVIYETNINKDTKEFIYMKGIKGKRYYARVVATNEYGRGYFSEWSDGLLYGVIKPISENSKVYNNLVNLNEDNDSILRFIIKKEGTYNIKVYNIKGDIVKEWNNREFTDNDILEWNLADENLPPSLYFVTIEGKESKENFKFLIVK